MTNIYTLHTQLLWCQHTFPCSAWITPDHTRTVCITFYFLMKLSALTQSAGWQEWHLICTKSHSNAKSSFIYKPSLTWSDLSTHSLVKQTSELLFVVVVEGGSGVNGWQETWQPSPRGNRDFSGQRQGWKTPQPLPPAEPVASKSAECDSSSLQCFDTVGWAIIQPVKSWMLVIGGDYLMELCISTDHSCHHYLHYLHSNKLYNGDILVSAKVHLEKMSIKLETE